MKKSTASDAKFRTDLVATLLQSLRTLTAARKRLAGQFGREKRRTKRCNGAAVATFLAMVSQLPPPADRQRYLAKDTVSEQILKRLQQYVAHASDKGLIGKRYPPATSEVVMESERQLGFQLNPFLRAVYLDVANGGFGPSYGLVGLPGGATDDQGKTIIDNYKGLSEYFGDLWPNKLVPICHYGCGMLGCVDCSGTDGAMTTWHPGLPPDDINLWWQKNFTSEDVSIIDWFTRWLDTTNAADLEQQM